MVRLHNFIISNSILLIYSALFDQDSLLSLVSIMKNRIDGAANLRKKIVSLMVEMLQNIIHHGNMTIGNTKGAQGIFYISEKNQKYYLTTINYIANDKKQPLKEKIDYINSLDDKGREQNFSRNVGFSEGRERFYNSRLFDFEPVTNKEAGLGLIEMRQKSKNPLEYEFTTVNEEHSLFKISTSINL